MTAIELKVQRLIAEGWELDIMLIPEQCASMHDAQGNAWHVEVDGQVRMPESTEED
jgi:hypothetical protein